MQDLLDSEEASCFTFYKCNWASTNAQSNACWGLTIIIKKYKQSNVIQIFILVVSISQNTDFAAQLIMWCKKKKMHTQITIKLIMLANKYKIDHDSL